MKRSGFKPRTSPMSRGAGLSPGSTLKRTGPLAKRSKKQARVYAGSEGVEGRAALVARLLAERPWCEVGAIIVPWVREHLPRSRFACGVESRDVHEILRRSASGSITDETNMVVVCGRCHDWIHSSHPKEARTLGLLMSRYAGRNEPTNEPS